MTYLPVAVEVAGRHGAAGGNPDRARAARTAGQLFPRRELGSLPPIREAGRIRGRAEIGALADRRLFAAARAADPLLTDTLLASLRRCAPTARTTPIFCGKSAARWFTAWTAALPPATGNRFTRRETSGVNHRQHNRNSQPGKPPRQTRPRVFPI